MEVAGERWAMELGLDDYDLPVYFDKVEGGTQWKIFCLNNHSHNTVVTAVRSHLQSRVGRAVTP